MKFVRYFLAIILSFSLIPSYSFADEFEDGGVEMEKSNTEADFGAEKDAAIEKEKPKAKSVAKKKKKKKRKMKKKMAKKKGKKKKKKKNKKI